MPARYREIEVSPSMGGRLMTNVSSEVAGGANYVTKRDWRRSLDQEIRREGYDYFWPKKSGAWASDPGYQPFPLDEDDDGPITLIHTCRRPNGATATVVGTPSKLYRFMSMENGGVCESGVCESGVLQDATAEWKVIGSGYSAAGRRWEVVDIDGWATFNNAKDLPCTYRIEEDACVPNYEMREQGIAYVGTIGEVGGVLMAGDVAEIPSESLEELFNRVGVRRSWPIVASLTAEGVVDASSDFFSPTDVGRTIVFEDDQKTVDIAGYLSPTQVLAEGEFGESSFILAGDSNYSAGMNFTVGQYIQQVLDIEPLLPQPFKVRTKVYQTGSLSSGTYTASIAEGDTLVESTGAIFDPAHVGKYIRFLNGWSSRIATFVSATKVTVDDEAPDDIDTMFHILTTLESQAGSSEYIATAVAPLFTEAMVGTEMLWDDGSVRLILAYISPTQVRVDSDLSHSSELVGMENPATYARYEGIVDRVHYRCTWSLNDRPRRWGAFLPCGILAESSMLRLSVPAKSFESGQQVTVLGVGPGGSNLTAEVLYVVANEFLALDAIASETSSNSIVQQTDTIDSIAGGYEDLQHDGSGILKIAPLQGMLVVYKDTSIFVASYTGQLARPFDFKRREVPNGRTLYYRNTLITVNSMFHMYAGRESIYRFDLANQFPIELQSAEVCKDLFYAVASLDDKEVIFASDNESTKEIMIWFPSDKLDKALCYDYFHDTWSTTSIEMTAAGTLDRPESGLSVDETPRWFVMATPDNTLVIYGKASEPIPSWDDLMEIYYRRGSNPYSATKYGYVSTLRSGMTHFGSRHSEKDVRSFLPHIGSKSPNNPIAVSLFGCRNPGDDGLLATKQIPLPRTGNLVPVMYRRHFMSYQLVITGFDNPCSLAAVTWEISPVDSRSVSRRL